MPRTSKPRDALLARRGWFPIRTVCARVSCNKGTVEGWIRDKHVEAVTIAGTRYVEWASVLTHLGPDATAALGFTASTPSSPTVPSVTVPSAPQRVSPPPLKTVQVAVQTETGELKTVTLPAPRVARKVDSTPDRSNGSVRPLKPEDLGLT